MASNAAIRPEERPQWWNLRERIFFYLLLFLFVFSLSLAVWGVVATLPWTVYPGEVAFLTGLLGFSLLANRLLFGYAHLNAYLVSLRERRATEHDARVAYARSHAVAVRRFEELTWLGIAVLWLDMLERYRYAYSAVFALLTVIAIVLALDPLGAVTAGTLLEGAFWGAATISLFVFLLEALARWQIDAALEEELEQVAAVAETSPQPETRT